MKKSKALFIDNIAIAYIVIALFLLSFIITLAQQNDRNLTGKHLAIFLICVVGSLICIFIRFVICFRWLIKQHHSRKRIFGLIYYIVCSIITLGNVIKVPYISNWSIDHEYLFNYTMLQMFMIGVVIAQWIGMKLFRYS